MQYGRENKSPETLHLLGHSKRMAEKEARYEQLRRELRGQNPLIRLGQGVARMWGRLWLAR